MYTYRGLLIVWCLLPTYLNIEGPYKPTGDLEAGSQGYKTFSMLNSAEQEISTAYIYQNSLN